MASRMLYGSRPNKSKDKEDERNAKPSGLPTRPAASSIPSTTSKIPTHSTSLFSRERPRRDEGRAVLSKKPAAPKPVAVAPKAKETPSAKSELRKASSSIPRGLSPGMGTRTEISASPSPVPPPRNRLRRKASSMDQRSNYARSELSASSHEIKSLPSQSETMSLIGAYADPFPESIFGITVPSLPSSTMQNSTVKPTPTELATSSSRMAHYMSRQPPPRISAEDLSLPTPGFARSSSASTRCSESPGPFSRTSTPTSASSYSPNVLHAPKFAPRTRVLSPTRSRPPVTRRKMSGADNEERTGRLGLPALRESLASTSSSSTVKAAEQIEQTEVAKSVPKIRATMPAPTPPLRLSSRRVPASRISTQPKPRDETVKPTSRNRSIPPPTVRPQSQLPQPASKIPPVSAQPKSAPPRPSRDGAPDLESSKPSPVIQSNLSHLATTGHTRRESVEKALLASPQKRSESRPAKLSSLRSPSSTSISSIKTSTGPLSAPMNASTPNLFPRESSRSRDSVSLLTETRRTPGVRAPSPMSASPARAGTKFGLFSRRTRTQSETEIAIPLERHVRRGPATGTGHEGYARYSRRGRSNSTSTIASRGQSTSTERTSMSIRPSSSRKSSFASDMGPELDDFYKDRLEPVVIGGGGKIRENRNSGASLYQVSSAESYAMTRSSLDSNRQPPPKSRLRDRAESAPGNGNIVSPKRASAGLFPPSRIETPRDVSPTSTLAERRSLHRSQLLGEAEPVKIPQPINTRVLAPSPMLDSFETTQSIPQTDTTLILTDDLSEGHEGNWLKPKKRQRVKLPTKWNFFQRVQISPKQTVFDHPEMTESSRELPAAVSKLHEARSVAYYAMLDGSEHEEPENLEDLLRDIEDNLEIGKGDWVPRPATLASESFTKEREHSMLLPSPPMFPATFDVPQRSYSPRVLLNKQNSTPEPAPLTQSPVNKEPRLQQIGRIPKVISKRDRIHVASPQSFSRPFARHGRQGSDPPVFENPFHTQTPVLAAQTVPLPSAPWGVFEGEKPRSAPPADSSLYTFEAEKEFIAFSPRKGSEVSGDSSSGFLSLMAMTAVMPTPGTALSDDEIWNEYDELLDHVASPLEIGSSSKETRAILNSFPSLSQLLGTYGKGNKKESVTIGSTSSFIPGTTIKKSPPSPPPQQPLPRLPRQVETQQVNEDVQDVTLLSEVYAGCGNQSSTARNSCQSTVSGSRYSSQTLISNSGSRSSTGSELTKRSLQAMAEKTNGSIHAPDSLRFNALMASRWLSFDRVLFSPAAAELTSNRQDRVLVLDGLGNDDWSSYCALTYPTTTIYNLATTLPSAALGDVDWQRPLNHRNIPLPSVTHQFPFPKGFFTAVVLRFPAAASTAVTQHAIAECKRVLRPGGYLELCILDMDMVNMGNRARRAVRNLKVRMQTETPEISLSPASDTIEKLLGRRGFENLSRCIVGVPVAGAVTESRSGSMAESSDGTGPFSDLLRGEEPLGGEEPMAKVVARVGRWWWSRCYERKVLAALDADASIWADRAMLHECEKRGTGFRLVVCYAQKPVNARRRTVSV